MFCGNVLWKNSAEKFCGNVSRKFSGEKFCGNELWKSSVEMFTTIVLYNASVLFLEKCLDFYMDFPNGLSKWIIQMDYL